MAAASIRISVAECFSDSGCHQYLSPQEKAQLPPASPAGIPRLVSGYPSPVYALFHLMCLFLFLGQASLCMSLLRVGFASPTVQ